MKSPYEVIDEIQGKFSNYIDWISDAQCFPDEVGNIQIHDIDLELFQEVLEILHDYKHLQLA